VNHEFAFRYGPWAVISGASEGTGRAFAEQLAAAGVHCVLVGRRKTALLQLVKELSMRFGTEVAIAAVDLALPDAAERIAAAVGVREVGLFISNAGGDPHGSQFLDQALPRWTELVQRNVLTMMQCCHRFAGPMKARGRGGILLVNSGSCYGGASYMAAYSATKAFTLCFGEGLWAELRTHGVDVLNLVLGRTDTPELRRFLAEKGLPVPEGLASPAAVAAVGLERLPHGPIHNWGLEDSAAGYAGLSAAARRERVVATERATHQILGSKP
jgi:short-subunit dehydrogenase